MTRSTSHQPALPVALLAEFVGTAALLCAVIGSGIMAQRMSGGNEVWPSWPTR